MVATGQCKPTDVEGILRSLSVDRKLSCELVKDYAALRGASAKEPVDSADHSMKEDSLRKRLESLIGDSMKDIRKLEDLLGHVDRDSTLGAHNVTIMDVLSQWKHDIALRLVLLNSLRLSDPMDLQRLLFMWLDSPYTSKLPYVNS